MQSYREFPQQEHNHHLYQQKVMAVETKEPTSPSVSIPTLHGLSLVLNKHVASAVDAPASRKEEKINDPDVNDTPGEHKKCYSSS